MNTTIANLKACVQECNKTINTLIQKLENERSAHITTKAKAHLSDDIAQTRSNTVCCSPQEITLLLNRLCALRKNSPKVHVTDDHAERVLEHLLAIVKKLEA